MSAARRLHFMMIHSTNKMGMEISKNKITKIRVNISRIMVFAESLRSSFLKCFFQIQYIVPGGGMQ